MLGSQLFKSSQIFNYSTIGNFMLCSRLFKMYSTTRNFNIPKKLAVPTYSDTTAFLDPDQDMDQILFKPKQVYAPRDLNAQNAQRIMKKREKEKVDVLEEFQIDPLKDYKNVRMLSHFVTEMGFIKPRNETGLSIKNQKKAAKAIRRARSMGNIRIF
jgi:ribosomal protein S18